MNTISEISDTDRGWIAGTLARSGSFTKNTVRKPYRGSVKEYIYPTLEFFSTEEWVVDRLILLTGVGKKYFRSEGRKGETEYGLYRWRVARQDEFRDLALEILPLLPPERREKLLDVL